MIEIRPLLQLAVADLKRIASGYVSYTKYVVAHSDSEHHASFELRLISLSEPYIKTYDHFDAETVQRYVKVLADGYSVGAYDDDVLVGLVIAEAQQWNRSLWVHEFHVAETHRKHGIGRRLMDAVAAQAHQAALRIIVCETQNTNATAIQAYRKLGFQIEGIDLSYYTNHDYPDAEIAVFMKRRLA
jgi:ribosomal protein S18 acetylase RimI-like enzyme